MRRLIVAALVLGTSLAPAQASAQRRQPAAAPEADPADEALDEEVAEEEGEPGLRAPEVEDPDLSLDEEAAEAEEEAVAEEEESLDEGEPIVDDATSLLEQAAPQGSDPTRPIWTAPESVFTLHGYLRVRGEFQDSFNLGRRDDLLPFSIFTPGDAGTSVPGSDCTGACFNGEDRMRWASMRMRLQPTLAISDDVRVHMMVDAFDNMVLGSTPNSLVYGSADVDPITEGRIPGVPLDSFTYSLVPPTAARNSLQDSIVVRRAWAEVVNRDIGLLRFGRMGNHWGLGMLYNGGDGLDSDLQSDVDRVMAVTRLAGFLFGAAWDFVGEGVVRYPNLVNGIPMDAFNRDDVRQFSFFAAHRLEEEEQAERLRAGRLVLNGGLYFVFRKQGFSSVDWSPDPSAPDGDPFGRDTIPSLVRRDAKVFTLDGWSQLLWRDLRLEVEAAAVFGSIGSIGEGGPSDPLNILQFGVAFESEYRLLNEKLGLYFYTGYATGDRDVDGLSVYDDTTAQLNDNDRLSHLSFHPNYRVDLILFRNVLGAIGGAWYSRPGISYDIIRDDFGQLLGLRADFIYSRAAREVQTYGAEPNLGLELNGSIYYRTEDGPEFWDGFYAMFQYGILFPLAGLNDVDQDLNLDKAQTLRLVMGVQF